MYFFFNSSNIIGILFLSFLTIIHSSSLFSQEFIQESIEPVIITATKTPTPLQKSGGSSVTVITQEEIQISQKTDVAEILKIVPGIDIQTSGMQGSTTSIFIRGADSKETLVLLDGIPFNDPSTPNLVADIGSLMLDNVERIEILRGSQSVLYGSNATAGMINIITKKGTDTPESTIGIMGGSFQTRKGTISSTGKIGNFYYSVAGSSLETEGFSTANNRNPDIPHEGNTDEKDGYKNTTLSANLSWRFNADHDISYLIRKIDADIETDDWGSDYNNEFRGYAGDQFEKNSITPISNGSKKQHTKSNFLLQGITLRNSFKDQFFESKLFYSDTQIIRNSFDVKNKKLSTYKGKTVRPSWQGNLNFEVHTLSFGIDQYTEFSEYDDKELDDSIDQRSMRTNGYWLHDQIFLFDEALIFNVGIRQDHHEKFGTANTYRLAPSYTIGNWKLKSSFGTGFRSPSLYELYSKYGNEKLEPEKSTTWDIGFEHQANQKLVYGITWFDMRFKNKIDTVLNGSVLKYEQVNGETSTNGAEVFIGLNPSKTWKLRTDYGYTYTQDPDGEPLTRRPNHKVSFKSDYQISSASTFHLDGQWVGERKAIAAAMKKDGTPVKILDPYTIFNIALKHRFSKYLEGSFRIDNLTDTIYETAWSYATPSRSFYAGLKAIF